MRMDKMKEASDMDAACLRCGGKEGKQGYLHNMLSRILLLPLYESSTATISSTLVDQKVKSLKCT